MNKILLLIALALLLACGSDKTNLPSGILPRKKMVAVLADFQLIEATLSVNKLKGKRAAHVKINKYYDAVLDSHKISREEFDHSYQYYADHPDILEQIYEEVINELSKKQAEAESDTEKLPQ